MKKAIIIVLYIVEKLDRKKIMSSPITITGIDHKFLFNLRR